MTETEAVARSSRPKKFNMRMEHVTHSCSSNGHLHPPKPLSSDPLHSEYPHFFSGFSYPFSFFFQLAPFFIFTEESVLVALCGLISSHIFTWRSSSARWWSSVDFSISSERENAKTCSESFRGFTTGQVAEQRDMLVTPLRHHDMSCQHYSSSSLQYAVSLLTWPRNSSSYRAALYVG